ncbi:hypothetical protein [Streptomyces halstedii]|uniref:hypothetical protein n=1 Tax=Streptomyces halstedii TaxID=1944 RepID=UPI003648CAC8
MRSLPLTFCAAAAAVAMAFPASATAAGSESKDPKEHRGSGTVMITPVAVTPGGEVQLRTDACGKGRSAEGDSEAFTSEARLTPDNGKGLHAEARIRRDATPGDYEVLVTCADGHGRATGTLTVVPRHHASPAAPVRAGGGGTADLAADRSTAEQGGPGLPHAVTGLALGAAAVTAVALRGARRRRAEHR